MWCISACGYVVGETKMTKIFAVYLQASGFTSQSSEYAFECCGKQLGRYDISLSYSSPNVDHVAYFVSSSCLCRFTSPNAVLEARSILVELPLNRRFSRSRRMRCRVGYYILSFTT